MFRVVNQSINWINWSCCKNGFCVWIESWLQTFLYFFAGWVGCLSANQMIYIYIARERERRSVRCVSGIISFIQITRQNIELNRIKKRNYTNNQPNNNHLLSSPFFVFVFVFYSTFFFTFCSFYFSYCSLLQTTQ